MGNSVSGGVGASKLALKNAVTAGDLEALKDCIAKLSKSGGEERSSGSIPASDVSIQEEEESGEALAARRESLSDPDAPPGRGLLPGGLTAGRLLEFPLNRKGDTALILAARSGHGHLLPYLLELGSHINAVNREKETVLDVILNGQVLPGDADILHNHFCSYSHASCFGDVTLPDTVRVLLKAGSTGNSIQRLILHGIRNAELLRELADLMSGLCDPDQYRMSGLLLQAAVWFQQDSNLGHILRRGVRPEHFWDAPFTPTVVPNPSYLSRSRLWTQNGEGGADYSLAPSSRSAIHGGSHSLQNLKLSFVQDWRAEWSDGENPAAQYRAGLHVTPEGAIVFCKAANRFAILEHVARDVMNYLPSICSGPELSEIPVIRHLLLAGYDLSADEKTHLTLKFCVNFAAFDRFLTQTKPLKHLCRTCIRFSLRDNVYCSMEQLDCLPQGLKDYLLLEDDHYTIEE